MLTRNGPLESKNFESNVNGKQLVKLSSSAHCMPQECMENLSKDDKNGLQS